VVETIRGMGIFFLASMIYVIPLSIIMIVYMKLKPKYPIIQKIEDKIKDVYPFVLAILFIFMMFYLFVKYT